MVNKRHRSNPKGIKSPGSERPDDFVLPGSGSVTRLRYAVVLITLAAVAVIFIAPSVDLPDGVLRNHYVTTHSGHSPANIADATEFDASYARRSNSATLVSVNTISSNRRYDEPLRVLRW
jgi:hypothetical protein